MEIWGIVERLKVEGVSNIAKEGLTSADGVSPFVISGRGVLAERGSAEKEMLSG